MFIYSVRASTVRFFLVIVLTLSVLVGILAFGGSGTSVAAQGVGIDFSGMKTNEDRIKFIESLGLKVEKEPTDTEEFSVPADFDRVISGYNEIQRKQGLDLAKYKNKKVTRYTYRVTNYEGYEGEVNVNLIIYKSTVIACDVSSADPTGFVLPLVNLGA